MTASDVAAAFWLHPSGASEVVLHGTQPVYIIDTIYSAAGTDTTNVELFINGYSTGVLIRNATSLATTITRPLQIAPVMVPAGAQFRATQRA